jgi:hypothetical protein
VEGSWLHAVFGFRLRQRVFTLVPLWLRQSWTRGSGLAESQLTPYTLGTGQESAPIRAS